MLSIDVALLASLATSLYTFFCNVGTGTNGIMPLIQGKLGTFDMSVGQKVKTWERLSLSGHAAYVPTTFLTLGLNLCALYLSPIANTRSLLWVSVALGIASIPYSLAVHPTMDKLKALHQSGALNGNLEESSEGMVALGLIDKWRRLQAGRTTLCGCIWGLCVAALMVDTGA